MEKEDASKATNFQRPTRPSSNDDKKAIEVTSTNKIEITELWSADRVNECMLTKIATSSQAKALHVPITCRRSTARNEQTYTRNLTARGKFDLVLTHSTEDGLTMVQLPHHEEMYSLGRLKYPIQQNRQAPKLPVRLQEQVSSEKFQSENYTDEVRHHMLKVIEQKVNGEEVAVVQKEPEKQRKRPPKKLKQRKSPAICKR